MNDTKYKELLERLKRDLRVVSYRLVDVHEFNSNEQKHYLDEYDVNESRRQQATEQNGNTGVHYLADLDNWISIGESKISNSGFKLLFDETGVEVFFEYKKCSGVFLGTFQTLGQAIKRAQDYLLNGE